MRNIEIADGRFFPNGIKPSLTNVHQANLKILPLLIKGGTTGQVLLKSSNLDYDVEWGVGGGILGANNGLTLTGSLVQWGGTLLQDTTIDGDGFNLSYMAINILDVSSNIMTLEANLAMDIISPTLAIAVDTALYLLSPNVVATTANEKDILTLIDENTGETDYLPLKYVQSFAVGDWVGEKITILESTHQKGINPLIQVFNGTLSFILVNPEPGTSLVEIKVLSNGDIELLTTASLEFDGKIIII